MLRLRLELGLTGADTLLGIRRWRVTQLGKCTQFGLELDHLSMFFQLTSTLKEALPSNIVIDDSHMNASADSFYSSQGRITSFPDHNDELIENLIARGVGSLEVRHYMFGTLAKTPF